MAAVSIPGPPGPPGAPGHPGLSSGVSKYMIVIKVHNCCNSRVVVSFCPGRILIKHTSKLCKNYLEKKKEVGILCVMEWPDLNLHVVALNTPQTGSMRGLIGVDAMCYKQAQAIKLKGTFRAFLSSTLQDLYSIVHSAQRSGVPIVNLKDEVLFDSWTDMFKDRRMNENVSIYSFDGKDVLRDDTWREKMVWHGSTREGQRDVNHMCESWRVSDQAVTGMAASLLRGSFTQQSPSSCSSSYAVLCIENSSFQTERKKSDSC
uniref:Collagenase NC10/endostatin domain-containing protein n=1 Tax=Oryzias melastigma TaxID=30732 RepID=A0A3B3DLR8_ORYME